MRLHIALACMLVTVVMMFAGSLFLYDYVTNSLDDLPLQQAATVSGADAVNPGSENQAPQDIAAMIQDIKSKQSAILLLQLAGVILLFWIVAAVLIEARKFLVIRVTRILTAFPNESISSELHASADDMDGDEIDRIEELVTRKAILLEGARAELNWLNKTSAERISRLMLAHDFFGMLITVFTESELTEKKLRNILHSLGKTLAANNVGLLLYKNTTLGLDGEPIFTRHIPTGYPTAALYQGGTALAMAVLPTENGQQSWRCMSVPLIVEAEMLGVLVVETAESHYFEDTEIQLAEITAKLLASALSVQTREQEGRRVALLEERAAIARELHDSLAQTFSYMKIQLARFNNTGATPDTADNNHLEIIQNLRLGLNEAYRELRELLATFRVQISTRGLDAAVKEAIEEFSLRSSLSIGLDNRLGNFSFTVNEQLHVLHIIREALSNVIRHADAKHAEVSLVLQSNGEVMVMIDDDGVGLFDHSASDGQHYGVTMIKERATSLGGALDVMPRRSGGTRVRLIFRPKLT